MVELLLKAQVSLRINARATRTKSSLHWSEILNDTSPRPRPFGPLDFVSTIRLTTADGQLEFQKPRIRLASSIGGTLGPVIRGSSTILATLSGSNKPFDQAAESGDEAATKATTRNTTPDFILVILGLSKSSAVEKRRSTSSELSVTIKLRLFLVRRASEAHLYDSLLNHHSMKIHGYFVGVILRKTHRLTASHPSIFS